MGGDPVSPAVVLVGLVALLLGAVGGVLLAGLMRAAARPRPRPTDPDAFVSFPRWWT